MFWAGSKGSVTPKSTAVLGINCVRPWAPAGENGLGIASALDGYEGLNQGRFQAKLVGGLLDDFRQILALFAHLSTGRGRNPGQARSLPGTVGKTLPGRAGNW